MSDTDTGAAVADAHDELQPAVDPNTEAANPPGDDAAAPAETPAKPKPTAQERINELTAKQRQAERDAEYWREQAMARQAPPPAAAPQPTASGEDAEPDPNLYEYGTSDAAYISDVATHRATKAVRAEFQRQREADQQQAQQNEFQTSLQTFGSKVSDQDEGARRLLTDNNAPVTREMASVLFESEAGVQVANYLGENYAESRRISQLPPHRQGYELARIEARLSAAPPPLKTLTDAPDPPPTARGSGGQFTVPPDTDDFAAFQRKYGPKG